MIERIANEFGLELEQEFTIHGFTYRFTKNGLYRFSDYNNWIMVPETLSDLITGRLDKDLIKTNWKPVYGETYYVPCIAVNTKVNQYVWDNDDIDNYLYTNNFICKTEEEAEEFYDYIIEKVKEYRNNDI